MDCAANIVTLGGGHETEEAAELCDDFFTMLCDDFMDAEGLLDPRAIASGLSVLCVGPRDAKVQSAFALFDKNQDGFISFDEMESYLTSVFKVLYRTFEFFFRALFVYSILSIQFPWRFLLFFFSIPLFIFFSLVTYMYIVASPNMENQLNGVPASTLGSVTTKQVFEQCDLNHDGRLSFDEFKSWYASSGTF